MNISQVKDCSECSVLHTCIAMLDLKKLSCLIVITIIMLLVHGEIKACNAYHLGREGECGQYIN